MAADRGPTTLNDLPTDALALILSNIPFPERFIHPPKACKAFRDAARPPSLAWSNLHFHCKAHGIADLVSVLGVAGTAVRDLSIDNTAARPANPAEAGGGHDAAGADHPANVLMARALDATCPYLVGLFMRLRGGAAWCAGSVATARGLQDLTVRCTRRKKHWGRGLCLYSEVALQGLPGLRPNVPAVRALLTLMSRRAPPVAAINTPTLAGGADCEALRIHRAVEAVVASPVRLTSMGWVGLGEDVAPDDVRGFTGAVAASLTRLAVEVECDRYLSIPRPAAVDALVALMAGLPALADLTIKLEPPRTGDSDGSEEEEEDDDPYPRPMPAVALDLRAVPPPAAARLTRLEVGRSASDLGGDLRLHPALAGRLACLKVGRAESAALHPPRCLHTSSGCGPFSRLTRLVYSGPGGEGVARSPNNRPPALNLAPWGHTAFSLPSLRALEIWAEGFTIEGYTGPGTWADAVATRVLPNLARLELVKPLLWEVTPVFKCRSKPHRDWEEEGDEVSEGGASGAWSPSAWRQLVCNVGGLPCPGAAEVEAAVMDALPASAAGRPDPRARRLAVVITEHDHAYESEEGRLHFEYPALGYES